MKIYLEDLKTEIKEEQCDPKKGMIVCVKFDENGNPVLVYKLYSKKELLKFEKEDIERWFETEYREKFEKCTRRIQMGIQMSDGTNPKDILEKLYSEAEEKASKIRELEDQIAKEK